MNRAFLSVWLGTTLLTGCGTSSKQTPTTSPAAATKPATNAPSAEPQPVNAVAVNKSPEEAKVRKFTFNYRFRVHDLQPADTAEKNVIRVWLPCPSNTDCQQVARLAATAPAKFSETTEARYGNPLLFFETQIPASGGFTVDVPYEITRHEVVRRTVPSTEKLDDVQRALFLSEDQFVPTSGKPLLKLKSLDLKKDPLGLARQLYDVVDDQVTYKKEGIGWGRGDTNWVCDSGYGNCTDFHSLFMSLARSQGLPTRFEIGFSIPTDKPAGPIAGYHCWAWFYADERGWIPVDISEADKHPQLKDYYFGSLTADRVMFSTGRDLKLVPPANHQPLNFMVYPYLEVGGETLPTKNLELQFAFKDIPK
jgi:hypothetical protein